jgi:hypothetical protein
MKDLINSCANAVDPGPNDDENGGIQFGHAVLSGHWKGAVHSWATIGTVEAALDLLAALFKIRSSASCAAAQLQLSDTNLLINTYIQLIVEAMLDAWNREVDSRKKVSTISQLNTHITC